MRALLHCTGLGKAILSQLDTQAVSAIIARHGLTRITPHTITTRARLSKELEHVRSDGYAIDYEENEAGVICVAAPVAAHPDGTVAAISVSGPASRVDERRTEAFSALVRDCAGAIEKSVGLPATGKGD